MSFVYLEVRDHKKSTEILATEKSALENNHQEEHFKHEET